MSMHAGLFVQANAAGAGLMPIDARRILGSIHGTALGLYSGGVLSLSSGSMSATVSSGVWRIPDPTDSRAVYQSLTDDYTFTIATPPSTGSRTDLIEIKQDDPGNGDADPYAVIKYVTGTSTPDAGYYPLWTVSVPSAATTASKCTPAKLVPDAYERSQRLITYDDTWVGAYTGANGYKWHDVHGLSFTLTRVTTVLVTMGVRGTGAGQGGMYLDIDNGAQEVFLATPQNDGISNAFATATLQLQPGTHTVDAYNAHWGDFTAVPGVITVNGVAMTRFAHIDLLS